MLLWVYEHHAILVEQTLVAFNDDHEVSLVGGSIRLLLLHPHQRTSTYGSDPSSVDVIGPGLSYTTIVDKTPYTFNLRSYHDYDAKNHFHGNSTIVSGTVRF